MPRVLRRAFSSLIYIPLILYTIFAAGPFIWTLMMSFRNTPEIYANPYGFPNPIRFQNYIDVWTKYGYATYFQNSIVVTVTAVVLGTMAGSMAAFVLARSRYAFPYRDIVYLLIFISIMFPPQITLLALFQQLVNYGLYNSLIGLILVYAASELPITVYLLRSFFIQIPRDIEDAARVDGAGDFRIFWQVMFPIAKPAIAAVIVLNFIGHWNEFLYALVFINKQELRTLPLAVMFFMGENFQDISMLATGMIVAIAPVLIIFIFFSETLIKGMTAGAVKG